MQIKFISKKDSKFLIPMIIVILLGSFTWGPQIYNFYKKPDAPLIQAVFEYEEKYNGLKPDVTEVVRPYISKTLSLAEAKNFFTKAGFEVTEKNNLEKQDARYDSAIIADINLDAIPVDFSQRKLQIVLKYKEDLLQDFSANFIQGQL